MSLLTKYYASVKKKPDNVIIREKTASESN